MRKSSAVCLSIIAISLMGCASNWNTECAWTSQVLPIKPSRSDVMTPGTERQILAANEAHKANCK